MNCITLSAPLPGSPSPGLKSGMGLATGSSVSSAMTMMLVGSSAKNLPSWLARDVVTPSGSSVASMSRKLSKWSSTTASLSATLFLWPSASEITPKAPSITWFWMYFSILKRSSRATVPW